MWLVKLALSRPYTFIVMALMLLLLGVLSILRTPTDIFPDIDIPVASVIWNYSGMPPQDMADRITRVFELVSSATVNNIEHMDSQSLLGVSVTKLYFHPGTDIALAIAQLTSITQTILKILPPGITPPFVLNYNASTVPVLDIVLSSKTLSEQRLNDLANNFVRPPLSTVEGASLPYAYGGKSREIVVDLNTQALQQFGLSANDIVNAVNSQSLIIPGGTEKIGPYEYIIQPNNNPENIEDFNHLPVIADKNTVITLREAAHVRDGFIPQTNIVNINGKRATMIPVEKSGNVSTLNIISEVLSLLPRIRGSLTKDLDLFATNNQSMFIISAIRDVITEGGIACGLTALLILLFLGNLRSTFMVVITVPLAIITSIFILSALGETINVMTLGGLALAVGMLVDDATVTIENINYHLEHGARLTDAILKGAEEVATPAIVSTCCISIVFLPMFFLSGISKYLFIPMAEAVIFAMMASYLLSRTLVPTMAYYLMGERKKSTNTIVQIFVNLQQAFERQFRVLQDAYGSVLSNFLEHKLIVIISFILVSMASLFLLWPNLGGDYFPKVDSGAILLHYSAHAGTRIEETAKISAEVNQIIRKIIPADELDNTVDNIGLPNSGINLTYNNSATNGANDTDTLISLTPKHHPVGEYIKRLRHELHQQLPGVEFAFLPADIVSQILNFGQAADVDIQISGLKSDANYAFTAKLLEQVKHIPGIVDSRIRQKQHYPTLALNIDRIRAKELGLTQNEISQNLLISLSGAFQTQPNFWVDRKNEIAYSITTQTPQYILNSVQSLLSLPITDKNNLRAPQILGAVASIEHVGMPQVVSHYNAQPVFDILASISERDLASVNHDLHDIINKARTELPQGSNIVINGIVSTQESTFSTLYFGLILSIVLIYLIIVINFQSWLDPFIIIAALPVALAGIAWMLFLTHTHLSVPALTGCIMAMGVATSNSILMVHFARLNLLKEKLQPKKASLNAALVRLRPVLITAIAMILGILPMSLGIGSGGEQNAPLGRAVIGGLLFATNATLFFVPCLFCFLHSLKVKSGVSND
jgi:multidrug efflux pump subunit AcrB